MPSRVIWRIYTSSGCSIRFRASSLGAVVILAQDQVHDEYGKPMREHGSFYVPNDYVLKLAQEHLEFLPAVSNSSLPADAVEELDRCWQPARS